MECSGRADQKEMIRESRSVIKRDCYKIVKTAEESGSPGGDRVKGAVLESLSRSITRLHAIFFARKKKLKEALHSATPPFFAAQSGFGPYILE